MTATTAVQDVKEGPVSLINVVVSLIVVGVLLWVVNSFIPMDRKIKSILNVVVVIAVILWILGGTGLVTGLDTIRIDG